MRHTSVTAPPSQTVSARTLFGATKATKPLYQLSYADFIIYKRIFEAQNLHDWQQANALVKRVHDPLLMGHALYVRYMNPAYRATYKELREWMVAYGDHPDAYKIYQMAQSRRKNDSATLPAPLVANRLFGAIELKWLKNTLPSSALSKDAARNEADISQLMKHIKTLLDNGRMNQAYKVLSASKASATLSPIEYDTLLSEIAARYYYNSDYQKAFEYASQATQRSGVAIPVGNWIAGLVTWRKGDFKTSLDYFEAVAHAHIRNPWMLSAGAYWASRAAERLNDIDASRQWLAEAADYDQTFYGLIAQNALNDNQTSANPELNDLFIDSLKENISGKRALALLDIDQPSLAKKELMQVQSDGNKTLHKALMAVASSFHFDQLASARHASPMYEAASYDVVPWKGDVRTGVNPALINALIRQESRFDPKASNKRTGALGLMQLMPDTAESVSDMSFNAKDMHKPEVNVALGQRYVRYLLDMPQIKGNLFYLAAAYNAGPGNLVRWQKNLSYQNDPLLFAESLPMAETRGFVQQVMTNYWVYSERFKQSTTTLDALAKGQWPVYKAAQKQIKLATSF